MHRELLLVFTFDLTLTPYRRIWYFLCNPAYHGTHAARGENRELHIFYNKLVRLAKLPVDLIFVFDGNLRPPMKRGARVIHRQHFLYEGMISFIEAFGFRHHTVSFPGQTKIDALF